MPSSTITSIGLAPAVAVYESTAANWGRLLASSLTCCPMTRFPTIGRTFRDCEPVHPLQPVCWSKPISGDRMTPRISIMSVPGRTVQIVAAACP